MQMIYNNMLVIFASIWLFLTAVSLDIFPHNQFACDPATDVYETEFIFLQGAGHGFVHAEPNRVYFEYYFPVEHWVAFATADQIIQGEQDDCSKCSFENYYPYYPSSTTNKNDSNLYPNCIEECLVGTIFVGSLSYHDTYADEENINNWIIIEFQIVSQQSKQLGKKMYRIPPVNEILEVWGSEYYPYREYAHFETETIEISMGQDLKKFVHARFWRDYDYQSGQNVWKPFVNGPYQNSNTSDSDSFCFISVGSFNGAYPYAGDALNGMLPGFYIDEEHFANIHCYKTNEIKVNCGTDNDVVMNENEKKSDDSISIRNSDRNFEESEDYFDFDTTTGTPIVININNDNTMKQFNSTKYWTQGPINKYVFDRLINYYGADFTVINFGAKLLKDRIFAPTWSEAEDKSKGMIFSDKNDKPVDVELWHINCVTSHDLCAGIDIRAYPTVRVYKRYGFVFYHNIRVYYPEMPEFVVYHGERKVDSILDFVKRFVESKTVPIESEINNFYKDVKPTVRNNENKRKDFDVIIGSHDFTFITFGSTVIWSEAKHKSNLSKSMIFSDKNGKRINVKLLYINCFFFNDLCSSFGVGEYPTVRIYRRDGAFVFYHERNVDALSVKSFVESETGTVAIDSEIRSENNLDEFPEVVDFGADYEQYDDTVEYDDNNAFESTNYYYEGLLILIMCIVVSGIVILYLICLKFNKKQTGKEVKEQILLYDSTTIETNLAEQEGI